MKSRSNSLLELQRRGLARFLFEAEGEENTGDEEAEEPTETEEEAPIEEPAETDAAPEEEEKSEELETKSNVKQAINDFLGAAEAKALKSAAQDQKSKEGDIAESRRRMSIRPLYEAAPTKETPLDVRVFAGEVARLVKNYAYLLDMERMIVLQAVEYLTDKYGENAAKDLEDLLDIEYQIDVSRAPSPPSGKLGVPNAVGARQQG
jgi:hypothetical protein